MITDESDTLPDSKHHSSHGVPAVGSVIQDRFETHEVFQRIVVASEKSDDE
ncbi:hypothetical protein [Haloarchaeobius sp. TZWWS8]|uniref:hypothetical protein n=1 Tax=Haloarchaeobius sp. TZWWS8 TaxID=3446121 RepID=UPI003EBA5D9A